MTSKIVPLNNTLHQHIHIKQDTLFSHAQQKHIVPVQAYEFMLTACNYPIVFIKDTETGEFQSVAMLGLQPNENLFYSPNGWQATSVPGALKMPPFIAASTSGNPENFTLCIDMNSSLVAQENGELIFDKEGQQTDFLKAKVDFISQYIGQTHATRDFINHLAQKNLLQALSLTVKTPGNALEEFKIKGVYAVNDKILQELSDQDFLELRKKHYLPLIYAHISSLNLADKLAMLKLQKATN